MIFRLFERSTRDAHKLGEFGRAKAAETFRDVTGRRRTGSSYLAAIIEIATGWQDCGKCDDSPLQFARQLPHGQIFKPPDAHGQLLSTHCAVRTVNRANRANREP